MELLRLIAFDKDDIEVVSTHLQDALVTVSDIHWQPALKRLVVGCARFCWEATQAPNPDYQRRSTALRFDRVENFKARGIDPAAKDRTLNLLAVEFEETDPPAGIITFIFSGGAALRLEIECLECELADLGPCWPTKVCPGHEVAPESVPAAQASKSLQG
jgi:hypothetical protein